MDPDFTWALLKSIVRGLSRALGDSYEVVLHDIQSPDSSIVAIENGHITGRKVGDPSTNLGLPVYENPYGDYDMYHYRTCTHQGKPLKSSSMYLKDQTGRNFAAICINWDISTLTAANNIIRDLISTTADLDESFATDVNELIHKTIEETIFHYNKPVSNMDRNDKLQIVSLLESQGVFRVKRSVERVDTMLGVSRVTLYGYINEVKSLKDVRAHNFKTPSN